MDQDFHYYGTYYAARVGGSFSTSQATLIAKAANFIEPALPELGAVIAKHMG